MDDQIHAIVFLRSRATRGWVVGVRAKSEVWVQDFAIIKVLDTAQWIRNAIWTTFNNASCIIFAK